MGHRWMERGTAARGTRAATRGALGAESQLGAHPCRGEPQRSAGARGRRRRPAADCRAECACAAGGAAASGPGRHGRSRSVAERCAPLAELSRAADGRGLQRRRRGSRRLRRRVLLAAQGPGWHSRGQRCGRRVWPAGRQAGRAPSVRRRGHSWALCCVCVCCWQQVGAGSSRPTEAMTKGTACMYNRIKLEPCFCLATFWQHTQLTVTHTSPQSAYPNVTSPMESRLGVCAPLFAAQSEVYRPKATDLSD